MNIVWFRRDLRVEDNHALVSAVNRGQPVVALYIATPGTWQTHDHSPRQADLIYRRLHELKTELAELGIPLYYAQVETFADSAALVAELALQAKATGLYLNNEYELNERRRDEALEEALSSSSVDVHRFDDKCIFPPGSVRNKQGDYFKVFTPYKRAYLSKLYSEGFHIQTFKATPCAGALQHQDVALLDEASPFSYPRESSERYSVKTRDIIATLREFVQSKADEYGDKRDFPALDNTSQLSPYLAIGALSVRQCMARLMYQQTLPLSGGREVWQSELVWREFYQHLLHFEPKLSRGESFNAWGEELRWQNNPKHIEAWKRGETGYPIVDAAMRQLNETGWMHNRLRMVVASFLVKDLHVDWRIGERYFMRQLIDGDYAANNGGWQWCASTGCDGQPYFRIFNPTSQGERFDARGAFIRRWVPELSSVPDKYIHTPWSDPGLNCRQYPQPIVDHKSARAITLEIYKEAKGN